MTLHSNDASLHTVDCYIRVYYSLRFDRHVEYLVYNNMMHCLQFLHVYVHRLYMQ